MKRYRFSLRGYTQANYEHPEGEYVPWEDYERLTEKCAEIQAELDHTVASHAKRQHESQEREPSIEHADGPCDFQFEISPPKNRCLNCGWMVQNHRSAARTAVQLQEKS